MKDSVGGNSTSDLLTFHEVKKSRKDFNFGNKAVDFISYFC